MNQTLNKINTSDFLGFLEDIFNITNIQKVEAIHKLEPSAINGFDFNNIALFGTNSKFGEFLEAKTGHKNLVFSFVKMTQAKEAKKQDLYKATTAINRTIPSYNIIFFYNQTHLHIAFAKRRLHKNRIIKKDVLDKISIIKDINLKKPSQAHLKNLKSLKEVASHQEVNVYYDEILEALSVENLNNAFYRDILKCFKNFVDSMDLPNKTDDAKKDFTLRLISRILFCKFLEKKGLIDEEIWKIKSDKYYHNVLEPLFFGTLNTPKQNRKYDLIPENIVSLLKEIPYLNGGLFNPQNDYYNTDNPLANISNLTVPNEPINKLFRTLDNYHFTIDEGSLKYEEIALDPELLGRIFESLLSELFTDNKIEKLDKQSIRKATGSFYTPREIVSYMVKESLKLYLQNSTDIKAQTLEKLFSDDCNEDFTQHKEAILEALKKIKILDPACGSGAFPMGILNEMLEIYEKLKDERKAYEIKKEILQNCIYGIDIQPMAIEISRLRAFLSLIIDEENDKIEPLPNLDFKFISANSLAKLKVSLQDSAGERLLGSDIYEKCFKELKKIREETFKSNCDKKSLQELYKKQIATLKNEVIFNENIDAIDALVEYNPFDSQSVAEFFDSEFMFGVKNFDIVIGNPPYIQIQSMKQDIKENYKNAKFESFASMGDIYQLFYEKCFNLLSPNGVVSLITSNKWMRAGYGSTTRKYFYDKANVFKLVDLGAGVFATATVDTNIIFYGRLFESADKRLIPAYTSLDGTKKTINAFEDKEWVIMDENERRIYEKISQHKPLKDWDIKIYRGVLTGFNEAFIIDEETRDRLIKEDKKSAELIKPILRGRDIKRYSYDFKGLYLICTFPTLNLNINNYPAIKKYLKSFGKKLEQSGEKGCRKKTNNKWFETQDTIAYYKEFDKEKIVYPETTTSPNFYYDDKNFIPDKTNFIMTGKNLKYIIAILSSKLGFYIFYNFSSKIHLGSAGFQYRKDALETIPIPKPDKKTESDLVALVDKIIDGKKKGADTSEFEREIDLAVYRLYGLSDEEIEIVENR